MTATLAGWWSAIWPNLVADVLWVAPGFVVHHWAMRRHLTRRLHEHHTRLEGVRGRPDA